MNRIIRYILLFVCLLGSPLMLFGATVPEHLQEISVTVTTNQGSGSGVIFTRVKEDGTRVNFIWTAAHVIDNLRKQREIIAPDGSKKTVVEFGDAKLVKELHEGGRIVGRLELDAEVLKYSDYTNGEDLALLRLRKPDFVKDSVAFYLEKAPPTIGTDLYHVGSLLGQLGSNSMTSGILSQDGRILDKKVFMQASTPGMPGSSGGGIFLRDGRYVGMLVRGAGETFVLAVPIRRIREFATRAKVEWALDQSVPLPSDEEIALLSIEDNPNLPVLTKTSQ